MDILASIGHVLFPAFFALLSLGRYAVNLGFVERPLFAGLIWGLFSGDMATAVSLAVFYELFWLDLFPAGTYLPPNALFPMLCVFTLAETLPAPGISTLFLPVILTLPLAFLGSCIEKLQREWQVAGYNRVVLSLRSGGDIGHAATHSVSVSLAQLFILNAVAFFAVTFTLLFLSAALASWQGHPLSFGHASWPLLWIIGSVGGVLGLRIRRNYIVFLAGGVCIGLYLVLSH